MDAGPSSIILILVLLLVNAFFAAAEMAIVSVNKSKINILAEEGDKKAIILKKLTEEPSKFLSTIQIGITLSGFFASASATTGISTNLGSFLNSVGVPYSNQIAVVIVTIVLSFFTLVLGELFPKRIALQKSEAIAMFVIRPIVFIAKIMSPFVKLLSGSTNVLVRLSGFSTDNLEEQFSKEELRSLIEVGQEQGVFNETEKEMINGIFEFDDTLAKEVMTPRTDVFMINVDSPLDKISEEIMEENFSRIPVYEEDLDNIIGILFIKDFYTEVIKSGLENIDLRKMIRPAYFVPETKNIDTLFKELQSTKNHMAILIDEYGGFSGIVTIEDLIEEVMGNIFDEYDEFEQDIKKLDGNTYLVNGLLPIDELNEHLHLSLESDNADTISGFVIDILGSIPQDDENATVNYENLQFKIEKVSEKRIDKLKLTINPETLRGEH